MRRIALVLCLAFLAAWSAHVRPAPTHDRPGARIGRLARPLIAGTYAETGRPKLRVIARSTSAISRASRAPNAAESRSFDTVMICSHFTNDVVRSPVRLLGAQGARAG